MSALYLDRNLLLSYEIVPWLMKRRGMILAKLVENQPKSNFLKDLPNMPNQSVVVCDHVILGQLVQVRIVYVKLIVPAQYFMQRYELYIFVN